MAAVFQPPMGRSQPAAVAAVEGDETNLPEMMGRVGVTACSPCSG